MGYERPVEAHLKLRTIKIARVTQIDILISAFEECESSAVKDTCASICAETTRNFKVMHVYVLCKQARFHHRR